MLVGVESGACPEIINHERDDKMLEDLRICAPDPWIILSPFMKGIALHFDRNTVCRKVFRSPCWLGLFQSLTVAIVEMELQVPQV